MKGKFVAQGSFKLFFLLSDNGDLFDGTGAWRRYINVFVWSQKISCQLCRLHYYGLTHLSRGMLSSLVAAESMFSEVNTKLSFASFTRINNWVSIKYFNLFSSITLYRSVHTRRQVAPTCRLLENVVKLFVAATCREKSNQTEYGGLVAGILLQRQRFSQKIIQYTRGDSRSEAMCRCN